MTVQTIPAIEDMTATQRVELMEALWKEMDKRSSKTSPPARHESILQERKRAVENGDEHFVSWENAKTDIFSKTIDRQ